MSHLQMNILMFDFLHLSQLGVLDSSLVTI